MNEIQIIYDWLINHFKSNELVNTISILPTLELDQNKENIYPLVNIDFINKSTESDVIFTTFKITVIQQRDTQPIKTDNKLLADINYLDNVNETANICTRFFNVLTGQNNEFNIELPEGFRPNEKPLRKWGINTCDGFQFEVTLSIPNMGKSC
jgi:hypothetical protein